MSVLNGPASTAGPRRSRAPAGPRAARPPAGPLLRAQPLPRHRPLDRSGSSPSSRQARATAAPTRRAPQILADLVDPVAARRPLRCLQPQQLASLLGGCVPVPCAYRMSLSYIRSYSNQPTSRPDHYEFSRCSCWHLQAMPATDGSSTTAHGPVDLIPPARTSRTRERTPSAT